MAAIALDALDRRLLSAMAADARQSTSEFARRLGVARTTIHERIARLERSGYIQGYTTILNPLAAGERSHCVVLLSIQQRRQAEIVERLRSLEEIKLCLVINGDFDLLLQLEAPRLEDIDAVIDEISAIASVERSKSLIVLSIMFDRRRELLLPLYSPALDLRA